MIPRAPYPKGYRQYQQPKEKIATILQHKLRDYPKHQKCCFYAMLSCYYHSITAQGVQLFSVQYCSGRTYN